jgi:hypothetical protein
LGAASVLFRRATGIAHATRSSPSKGRRRGRTAGSPRTSCSPDARIEKAFTDRFNVSLEVGVPIVKQYPVYNFMTALRVNLTF